MDRSKGILKNTLKFMAAFMVITLIFIFIWMMIISFVPTGTSLYAYVPTSGVVDPKTLSWESIAEVGGGGVVLDENGKVIESYGKDLKKNYFTKQEILDFSNIRAKKETVFVYETSEGNRLLLIYPKDVFDATPTLNIDSVMGRNTKYFSATLLLGLVCYLFLIFLLIRRLYHKLKTEIVSMREEEEERKDLFLRGLAHDIKTPLSTMISYSRALEDGIVEAAALKDYYKSISRNGALLNERFEDMMNLIALDNKDIFKPERKDLLEGVRRFIGEHYTWFVENGASIDILFEDTEIYVTDYDPKLLDRMLENLLQNSVYHNQTGIHISVDWNHKNQLIIGDDGVGISGDIQKHMWEPMVTGDKSRTGDTLRGMGLANVKKIVELHQWDIKYDGKFIIKVS